MNLIIVAFFNFWSNKPFLCTLRVFRDTHLYMHDAQFLSSLIPLPGQAWSLGCAQLVLLLGATQAAAPERQVQPTQ